jgi:hypothetical protein
MYPMLDITAWWSAKPLLEQIFWGAALPASLLLLAVLVTTLIGADAGDANGIDAQMDADSGAGFQFFTVKNLIGFFTIFGWVGIGCSQSGLSDMAATLWAVLSGLLMMAAMAALFYSMSKLVEDGTMRMSDAIGRTAEVYLPIPGASQGMGKVQMNLQGAVREMQAMTRNPETLPRGAVVQVTELIDGNILVVSPLAEL